MAVWSERFEKEENEKLEAFNASLSFDQRLYQQDIEGSLAHLSMLKKTGIVDDADYQAVKTELETILNELKEGVLSFSMADEDIHMAIESELTKRLGSPAKKLHTARSRNDQVALDLRLYLKSEIKILIVLLADVEKAILALAKKHTDSLMPGYTHLQRAQPISLAHWMMAYGQMFYRDIRRLENTLELMDESPLGAGALAATTYPIDRFYTAELLGFDGVMENSLDAVSDRDYCIELLSDASIVMMHLSRLCEELILFSSTEYGFVSMDDAFSTGSSIMPQKKNPDLCELIRGKTGRVYGSLMTLLTILKGLPLAYNKDLQEDKEAVFDAVDTVKACLELVPDMLLSTTYHVERMEKACEDGYLNATDLADYLTRKGLPFREAYKLVQRIVRDAANAKKALSAISLEEYQDYSPLFDQDVYESLDLRRALNLRNVFGGPSPERVIEQIERLEKKVEEYEE